MTVVDDGNGATGTADVAVDGNDAGGVTGMDRGDGVAEDDGDVGAAVACDGVGGEEVAGQAVDD